MAFKLRPRKRKPPRSIADFERVFVISPEPEFVAVKAAGFGIFLSTLLILYFVLPEEWQNKDAFLLVVPIVPVLIFVRLKARQFARRAREMAQDNT